MGQRTGYWQQLLTLCRERQDGKSGPKEIGVKDPLARTVPGATRRALWRHRLPSGRCLDDFGADHFAGMGRVVHWQPEGACHIKAPRPLAAGRWRVNLPLVPSVQFQCGGAVRACAR